MLDTEMSDREDDGSESEEEADYFAMADSANNSYNPLLPMVEQTRPREAVDDATTFAPNFLFRVHCQNGGGSASIVGTRMVYAKGTFMGSEQHGTDCIYRRTWTALKEDFTRHLGWKKPPGYRSPFISWSTSLHMVLYRAFTGWYNVEDRDVFLCFLDLRRCNIVHGNVLGVTDRILDTFCDHGKELIAEKKKINKFTTEILTYGNFNCQGALTMVNWTRVMPLFKQLYPTLAKMPHRLPTGMNEKAQTAREKWSKETLRFVTDQELRLAIEIARLFCECVDGKPVLQKTDPNLVLALLGCLGNVSLHEDQFSTIRELHPTEDSDRSPYPGQKNGHGKLWGECCQEVAQFQEMSDQVRGFRK